MYSPALALDNTFNELAGGAKSPPEIWETYSIIGGGDTQAAGNDACLRTHRHIFSADLLEERNVSMAEVSQRLGKNQ